MTATTRLTLALATASAYSAFPAAYYHVVQQATGSRWTTAVLFTAHGIAQVAAMSAVARLARGQSGTRVAQIGSGRIIAVLLLLDAAGAVLLVLAPAPNGAALLLVGRVVTGLALGAMAPLATAGLSRHPRGPELGTVAILGAVGAGSLTAGLLAGAGWDRAEVLALGLVALPVAAWLVRDVRVPVSGGAPAGSEGAVIPASMPAGPASAVTGWAVLAFAANGVLGLFCSTLPGVVAALAQGAAVVAGATTGLVMISAGSARLLLGGRSSRAVLRIALLAAAAGLLVEVAALAGGHLAGALCGAVLLGAAAGLGFDAALRQAAPAGVSALARVQRGGQLGLVLPVLAYPVVVG